MKSLPPIIANSLWQALSTPSWQRFHRTLANVENEQTRILKKYLKVNQKTDYGRRYNFASISSIDTFQKSVPLTTYEDYVPQIEAIGQGRPRVLTDDPVLMFEITSGSTSASKMIPYTQS
ncbi:MAG: GH3 auxin-responsive promoter family protein, partial [Desulfobulbaceae bacterium]|nr:GH3 auxin-responsive promoter family protein [Desulfobulbaceae bacterium]